MTQQREKKLNEEARTAFHLDFSVLGHLAACRSSTEKVVLNEIISTSELWFCKAHFAAKLVQLINGQSIFFLQVSFGGIFKDFDSELTWKEILRQTVSVEKERMDIFHFNMALIELLSMIFVQKKKANAWLLRAFLCVFFAQQSRNKCTAAVLGKLTSGAKEIKMDRGSPLRRYFAACSTVWLSHGRPSKSNPNEKWIALQQNPKFSLSSWKISNNFTWIDQQMDN